MTLAVALRGMLIGVGVTAVLTLWDRATTGGLPFGLRTGLIGVAAGGVALLLAFGMAVSAYLLASRNMAPALRKRLVISAVFAGCCGMVCGLAAAAIWLAVGHPWFP